MRSSTFRSLLGVSLGLVLACAVNAAGANQPGPKAPAKRPQPPPKMPSQEPSIPSVETKIGIVLSDAQGIGMTLSPDGRRLAYSLEGDAPQAALTLDGVTGPEYEQIGPLAFSPDSRRVAYAGRSRGKTRVIVDGRPGAPYDRIEELAFSPDSGHLCFSAKKGPKEVLVVDGKEIPDARWPAFAADGTPAYVSGSGSMAQTERILAKAINLGFGNPSTPPERVVYAGVPGKVFDEVLTPPTVTPEGVAYLAKRGNQTYSVLGTTEKPWALDGSPAGAESPDGKRVALWKEAGDNFRMVVDGKASAPYASLPRPPWVMFSSDGKRLAYNAIQAGKEMVVLDDTPGQLYDEVSGQRFTSDGRLVYRGARGAKAYLVVDGQEGKAYDTLFYLEWRRGEFVCAGSVGGRHFVLRNGKESAAYEEVTEIWFAPDEKRVAFGAKKDGKNVVIAETAAGLKEFPALDGVQTGMTTFSPDLEHVIYGAKRGRAVVIMVDGRIMSREADSFAEVTREGLLSPASVVFDSPKSFHTWIERDRVVFQIQVPLP